MPRTCDRRSLGDGGCDFALDPDAPARQAAVIWLPEVAPSTLIIDPAPHGFTPLVPIDPARLGSVVDIADGAERELVIVDGPDELHLRLRQRDSAARPAILLTIDDTFDIRRDVASRFVSRLLGRSTRLLPTPLRLTSAQRARLVRLLHAYDVHALGGGPREIAALVLGSAQSQLPAVEWKDSHARRAANRLIHDSIALVDRGYLKLLRGR